MKKKEMKILQLKNALTESFKNSLNTLNMAEWRGQKKNQGP